MTPPSPQRSIQEPRPNQPWLHKARCPGLRASGILSDPEPLLGYTLPGPGGVWPSLSPHTYFADSRAATEVQVCTHTNCVSSWGAGAPSHSSLHTQGPYLKGSKAAELGASKVTSGLHSSLLVRPGPLRVTGASQVVLVVKNPPASAGDTKRLGSIPGSGRSPGGGDGNPLQYSCLEKFRDRIARRTTVRGVAKSQPCLKRLSMHGVPAGGM